MCIMIYFNYDIIKHAFKVIANIFVQIRKNLLHARKETNNHEIAVSLRYYI